MKKEELPCKDCAKPKIQGTDEIPESCMHKLVPLSSFENRMMTIIYLAAVLKFA